jgi:hypothetical protein
MGAQIDDVFPALQQRRSRRWIDPNVEAARRVLWSAFERGKLTEEELISTLERLEFASVVQWDQGRVTAGKRVDVTPVPEPGTHPIAVI